MTFCSLSVAIQSSCFLNQTSKGSVEIRHRCYGLAELFGFGHCSFGLAESWFGRIYENKIRPNLQMSFGRIKRFGAPLLVSITLIHHFCIDTRNVFISTIFVHQRHDFEGCLYKHNINTPFLQEKSNVRARIIILHLNFENVFVSNISVL